VLEREYRDVHSDIRNNIYIYIYIYIYILFPGRGKISQAEQRIQEDQNKLKDTNPLSYVTNNLARKVIIRSAPGKVKVKLSLRTP
jgi:hypothetical protein